MCGLLFWGCAQDIHQVRWQTICQHAPYHGVMDVPQAATQPLFEEGWVQLGAPYPSVQAINRECQARRLLTH